MCYSFIINESFTCSVGCVTHQTADSSMSLKRLKSQSHLHADPSPADKTPGLRPPALPPVAVCEGVPFKSGPVFLCFVFNT